MKKTNPKNLRILAVAPSTRGFGFAVMQDGSLVDWGVKPVTKGDKNAQCLTKLEKLVIRYEPEVLTLENYDDNGSRRAPRIKALGRKIVALAARRNIKVAVLSRQQMRQAFFTDGQGTKHVIATILAGRFSEELASRLPPERQPWTVESYGMGIFDAVALAMTYRRWRRM